MEEYDRQLREGNFCEAEFDGFSGFIFQSKHGKPLKASTVDKQLISLVVAAN